MGRGLKTNRNSMFMGISGLALISALGFGATARAAEASAQPAPPTAAAPVSTSEEVVVYARKRSETALETPLAITAMSEAQVRQQSIVNMLDLSRAAPNVVIRQSNSGGGTIEPVIRGQSMAIANIGNDPPVGIYFDDVIAAQTKGAAAGIFDVQSIEVSRGVQGTLRGRNNTGGAISIYTHKPDLGKYEGELSATIGSREYKQFQGILNVPVGDWAALRFAYQNISQDEQGHSTWSGQGYSGRNQYIARVSALIQPTDALSWVTTYEHSRIGQLPVSRRALVGSQTYNALITGTRSALNASGLQLTPDQIIPENFYNGSTGFIMAKDYASTDFIRSTLNYKYSKALNFKLVAGYRELLSMGGIDLDGTPALQLESTNGGSGHQLTLEPQISGEFLDGKLNYVAGYYYFHDRGQLIADTFAWAVNAANPAAPFRNHILIREGATNTSNAGYLHVEYKATDKLELAAGYRYTADTREVRPLRELVNSEPTASTLGLYRSGILQQVGCLFTTPVNGVQRPAGGFVILGGNAVASGACPNIQLSKSYGFGSYEVSAKYKLADNVNVYFRHGLGQKSGGFNVPVPSTSTPPFAPEKVRDYEVGIKGDRLLDGRLDGALALYYSDYTGLQRLVNTLLPGGLGVITAVINAGSATIKGVEAQFNYRLTDNLRLNGFAGYTDAKYDSFIAFDASGNPVNLTNQPFVAAPEWTSRLAALYDRPLADGTLTVGVGWNHQSSASLQAISFPGAETGVIDLVDARISWLSADRSWEAALYGTNLTDSHYFTAATVSRAGIATAPSAAVFAYGNQGERRFVGVSLTKRWQ